MKQKPNSVSVGAAKLVQGAMRHNEDLDQMEVYDGARWRILIHTVEHRLEIRTATAMAGVTDYYTAEVINAGTLWDEIMPWMNDNFGPAAEKITPGLWREGSCWFLNRGEFWFKNKKDLDWFVLRWSS